MHDNNAPANEEIIRFDRRLASFSRLIRFDPSGVGLSDPLAGGAGPTVEQWMQDAVHQGDPGTDVRIYDAAPGTTVTVILPTTGATPAA